MALTGKIKVMNVQAADPQLTFTLMSDDGGTFPARVKVRAELNSPGNLHNYEGEDIQNGGSVAPINFDIQFTDPNYRNETTLDYTLTIYFPDGSGGWTPFSGWVDSGAGTVIAQHGGGDDKPLNKEKPAEQGAKNKGCMAFLGMLPF